MSVVLSTTTPRPGETLRIEIDGISPSEPLSVQWNKKSYRLYPVGPNAQRALIGVPLGSPAGSYPLIFRSARKGASLSLPAEMTVQVATRAYVIEDVVFPASKTRIFNESLERREGAMIHKVLLQVHADQFWEGHLDPPVNGPIEGVFGVKRLRNHTIEAGFHKGIDLKASANTPVRASNNGIVALARSFHIHGRTIIVDHGQGVMTIYLHMKSFAVRPGQRVAKGDILGRVGSTGLSTAPHVHWGVYVHGVPVDPQAWMENEF